MGVQNVRRGRQRSHRYPRDDENRSGTAAERVIILYRIRPISQRYCAF